MLKAQRRHLPPCPRPMWEAGYTKCGCPIAIRGTLAGKHITVSTAKFLPPDLARNFEAARDLALRWEREGRPVRPAETAAVPAAGPDEGGREPVTIRQAVDAYMSDGAALGNALSTLKKKANVFTAGPQSLLRFAAARGLRFLPELDIVMLREWRASWQVGALSRFKRQNQVIGFLWFCERSKWLPGNFATETTKALGKIKYAKPQTGYFEQMNTREFSKPRSLTRTALRSTSTAKL